MTNKQHCIIKYTDTAMLTIYEIRDYLQQNHISAKPFIDKLRKDFRHKVSVFPEGSPISPDCLEMGVTEFLECNLANNYRVLYTVEKQQNTTLIYAHAILSQRQSISKLLFRRLIM